MTATREDIEGWLDRGVQEGATHLIVACDAFDHDNYPVFVKPGQDVVAEVARIRGQRMQTVDEVYDLSRALKPQLETGCLERTFQPEVTRTAGIPR
jgi:hypothetical protein